MQHFYWVVILEPTPERGQGGKIGQKLWYCDVSATEIWSPQYLDPGGIKHHQSFFTEHLHHQISGQGWALGFDDRSCMSRSIPSPMSRHQRRYKPYMHSNRVRKAFLQTFLPLKARSIYSATTKAKRG